MVSALDSIQATSGTKRHKQKGNARRTKKTERKRWAWLECIARHNLPKYVRNPRILTAKAHTRERTRVTIGRQFTHSCCTLSQQCVSKHTCVFLSSFLISSVWSYCYFSCVMVREASSVRCTWLCTESPAAMFVSRGLGLLDFLFSCQVCEVLLLVFTFTRWRIYSCSALI